MIERWGTLWLGIYGALVTLMWATLKSAPLWHLGGGALAVSQMAGGLAIIGMLVVSAVALRNLMRRAK